MLRGVYGEQTGRKLFAATAELTRLAGWTSYDIAAHGLAQRYFVQALRLAQAAPRQRRLRDVRGWSRFPAAPEGRYRRNTPLTRT